MFYVCPTCEREFCSEDAIRKHFLSCWKEQHPYHKSNSAPHSEDIVTKEINNDIMTFFNSFSKRNQK